MINNLYAVIFAGLPHVYRDFKDKPLSEVLEMMSQIRCELEAAGIETGYTDDVAAACIAAFQNEPLQEVNSAWWWTYDQERDEGALPDPQPEGTWEP